MFRHANHGVLNRSSYWKIQWESLRCVPLFFPAQGAWGQVRGCPCSAAELMLVDGPCEVSPGLKMEVGLFL